MLQHIPVGMALRVHCTWEHEGEECPSCFEVEVPVHPIALFTTGHVEFSRVTLDCPAGWDMKPPKVALCPKHSSVAVPIDTEEFSPEQDVGKGEEEPTAEILARAERLQALAIDKGTTDGERAAAWAAFSKLWKQYNLPDKLGLEGLNL
jgi:hypothetical protein